MLYQKRTVRCPARGLTREAAQASLERSPKFSEDTEILDFKRRGDSWVATLLEPKKAEFPPQAEEEESGPPKPPSDDAPFEDDEPAEKEEKSEKPEGEDGPPKKEGPGEPKGEKAELALVMDMLTQIADKLGIVPGGDPMAMGAEDAPLPPPPGPPPGPPGGGHPGNEILHRTKLKPGETPPGGTPVGAPAFASTDLTRLASFDAFDDTPQKSIREAKAELDALYGPHGFRVRQIKRVEGGARIAAKLSRR